MPIAWDTAGGAGGEDPSSLTTGSVSPSGSDRLMIGASMSGFVFGTLGDTTAFKYGGSGGTDLSQVGADLDIGSPATARCSVWSIAPGPTGSTTGYASYSGPPQAAAMQASFYTGVDQGTPYGTPVDDSGEDDSVTSTRASVTVTGLTSGDWVSADFFAYTPNATELGSATSVAGTNLRRQQNDTAFPFLQTIHVDAVAAGSSLTLEVDLNSTGSPINFQWAVRALPLNEASSGIEAVASDTNTPTDSAVSTTERLATASDTNTPTDSAVSVTQRLSVATDSLALSDSAGAVVALAAVAEDSISLSDSAISLSALVAVAEDAVTFSDSAASGSEVIVEAEDTVAFSDSAVGAIGPPPPPPPPPSVLPLPAKLLGWAPGKKPKKGAAKTGNVVFKPVSEERAPAPEASEPAPPPPGSPSNDATAAPPPIAPAPLPEIAPAINLAALALEVAEAVQLQPIPAAPIVVAEPEPETPPQAVEPPPLEESTRALIAMADQVAKDRAALRALTEDVQVLRTAVRALGTQVKIAKFSREEQRTRIAAALGKLAPHVSEGGRQALRDIAAALGRPDAVAPERALIEAENERRRKALEILADELDD